MRGSAYALRQDGGSAEAVGVVLCVGLTVLLGLAGLALASSYCPGCVVGGGQPPADVDPWSYCEGREFERPACEDGAPVFAENEAGAVVWCHLHVSRKVVGAALVAVQAPYCVEVAGVFA